MGPKPKSTCQDHGDPKLGFKIHKTRDRDPEREREREEEGFRIQRRGEHQWRLGFQ